MNLIYHSGLQKIVLNMMIKMVREIKLLNKLLIKYKPIKMKDQMIKNLKYIDYRNFWTKISLSKMLTFLEGKLFIW